MEYMIHTCKKRLWYINDYLLPSMLSQGIPRKNIHVHLDYDNQGNLRSFIDSCYFIKENYDIDTGIWHLQDDVIICTDFYKRTKEVPNNINIRCGYVNRLFNKTLYLLTGNQPIENMWISFPCIYIPNRYMVEFIGWLYRNKNQYAKYIDTECYDDFLFMKCIKVKHKKIRSINMKPNLIDHIDYLIGGSTLYKRKVNHRAEYFEDKYLVDELERKLRDEKQGTFRENPNNNNRS